MKSQSASAQALANGFTPLPQNEERRNINSELWHACAGPLVSLPTVGSLVVYFPQGHSEQVAASMQKGTDTQIPSYPNLPPMLICQLLNLSLHADGETDEVYAQMTLQPVNTYNNKDAILTSDLGLTKSKHPTEFFCKTLTASDTSTHGGFSVPRRSAEKIFPPLDFSLSPPAQEIVARDLHDTVWNFRHIYRGQPKRHLLTTGWSVFVSAKRLFAGDSVLFIRDEKQQLLLGIRRANRQQPAVASSVLSSDSMHIGVLAAAAHAASNQSPFTVFYNPRASPSEFVIPLSKYNKAIYGTQVSLGMRFRMMFETEESGVRRYMGTITGISDLDSIRWPNSQWRNIQVGWDESSAGEKRKRVSIWEIEPVATPFFICPPPFFRPKRPRPTGFLGEDSDIESAIKRSLTWYGDDMGISNLQSSIPGVGLMQWMHMQQRQDVLSQSMPADYGRSIAASALQGSTTSKVGSNDVNKSLSTLHQALPPISGQVSIPLSQQSTQQQQQPQILWSQQQQQQQLSVFPSHQQQPQQQQQQSIHTQQQISSSQHLPQMDNHLQPQKLNQQLQSLTSQQLHQRIQQLQQSQAHAQLQSQAQATQQQQQLQRLQQLQQHSSQPVQQQPLQPQQNVQRLEQEPQAQQQQQNIHTSQQVHPYQTQLLPSPRDQAHNQYAQPAIMTSQHLQQPTQLPEVHGQMLQPNHNRAMAVVSKPQSGFPDSDLPSCSTSTSTNSYSLQNMISRPTHTMLVAAEEKPQICNIPKVNITSLQAANPTVTGDQHVNSLIPPVKESSSNTSLHNYVNAHLGQMEASSVPGGFSLGQSDISITQSIPLLSHESSPFLVRDGPSNNDVQTDSQRNSLSRYSVGKDIQSHLCAPTNSQPLGVSEIPQDSVVQVDAGMSDGNMLQRPGPLQQATPPMRTYTKVHKLGSVGRSIDVTRCKNYDELRRELARLFGLEGQLEDPQRSGWQLVFVDNENDVLLVGDDPWEEFVSCVRGIRILSPSEVLQMSQEGLELLNNLPLQQQACSSSDGAILWREHGDQNSNNPSAGSFDH